MNHNNNNKVARLRKAISEAINSVSAENGSDTPDFILADFLTDCLEAWNTAIKRRNDWYAPKALAPAQEESANPTCSNTTHKFSHCDCEKTTPIETDPEWRYLGPDEEICEGDETTYWMCGTDLVESFGYARSAECYEKELAACKAEVERLKKELAAWDYGTRAKREQEARKKAEADNQRLINTLVTLLHITNCYDGEYAKALDSVNYIVTNALKNK